MILKRCCQGGSCGPQLPDWFVVLVVGILVFVFGGFLFIVIKDLFGF